MHDSEKWPRASHHSFFSLSLLTHRLETFSWLSSLRQSVVNAMIVVAVIHFLDAFLHVRGGHSSSRAPEDLGRARPTDAVNRVEDPWDLISRNMEIEEAK